MQPESDILLTEYHPKYSSLPKDGLELIPISPIKKILIKAAVYVAKWLRIWRYPLIHDPDNLTFRNILYFFYKTLFPIIHAEKGTDLEQYFEKAQNFDPLHLPKHFLPIQSVSVSAAGDMMNSPNIENSQNWFYYKISSQLFERDISFANLESTLTTGRIEPTVFTKEDMPKINATEEQYLTLKGHHKHQYTILSTANNHILDCGLEGLETTLKRLKRDKIYNVGTQLQEEDANSPTIVMVKGIKLAVIAVTYSLNLRPYPNNQNFLVNKIPFHQNQVVNLELIHKQIATAHKQKCDFIILSLHWGMEFEFFPTERQVAIAHQLAQDGVDMIISHHAHCVQTYELYQVERDHNRIVPIYYGLGNLTAIMSANHTLLSFLLNFILTKGSINSENLTFVESADLTPVFQLEYKKTNSEQTIYTIEYLEEWLEKSIENTQLSKRIKKMGQYCELVLGKDWEHLSKEN